MTRLRQAYCFVSLLVCAGAITACATARTGARTTNCPLAARDSVFLVGGTAYRDCAVARRARLVNSGTRPDFQPSSSRRNACYSAEIEFVVDTAGVPEVRTARVVTTNDDAFAKAILETVGTWRYEPALLDGAKVRQIVTERRSAQTSVVAVPVGGALPTGPVGPSRPNC